MKQQGRIKFMHAGHKFGRPYKVDVHPQPKKIYVNWWENLDMDVSRSTIKFLIKRMIEDELNEQH